MSLWRRGTRYWTDFAVGGRRYRKSLGTSKLQDAKRRERDLIESAKKGILAAQDSSPKNTLRRDY